MTDSDQSGQLGVNLVQRRTLESGHIFRQQHESDFGIDAQIELKNDNRATGRLIAVQIKAGPSWLSNDDERGFTHYISERHMKLWLKHSLPVILVLCDLDADVCYYEIITTDTLQKTPTQWKVRVPKSNILSGASTEDLASIASPIVAASDYTIFRHEDVSHANARRISLDIVAHVGGKALNKPLLGAIVRDALAVGREIEYFRDDHSERAVGDRPVDVVFGFIYLREGDRNFAAWVCRFQWISAGLDQQYKPLEFDGEKDGSGLVIEWKLDSHLPRIMDEMTDTKAGFLSRVDTLLARLPEWNAAYLNFVNQGRAVDVAMALVNICRDIEGSWDGSLAPPRECQRLNQAVQELLAHVGNTAIIWQLGQPSPNRKTFAQMESCHKKAHDSLNEMLVYLKDVR